MDGEYMLSDNDIMEHLNLLAIGNKDIQIADTFFISELERNEKRKEEEERIQKRKRILEKARPRDGTLKWIIPIHHDDIHWILAVVDTRKSVITLYDSLKIKTDAQYYAMKIRDILDELKIGNLWKMVIRDCFKRRQPDEKSCGIFVIVAAYLNIMYKNNIVVDINMLCNPWDYLREAKEIQKKQDFNTLPIEKKHPFCNLNFTLS